MRKFRKSKQQKEIYTCVECGADVKEDDKICPNCGSTFTGVIEDEETEDVTENPSILAQTFTKDEKIIATLGQKFYTSFFVGSGLAETSIMLTNKRLYLSGTTYSSKGKYYQTLVGEVRSLDSIGLTYDSNFWLLAMGVPLLLLFGLGLIFIIMYYFSRERLIKLNFGGEITMLSLRGISNDEVENFIKKVMIAKENER